MPAQATNSMIDLMWSMQKLYLDAAAQSLSAPIKIARIMQNAVTPIESRTFAAMRTPPAQSNAATDQSEEVLAVGEETVQIGKRVEQGKITRVVRTVVEEPFSQDVQLLTHSVVVERREPAGISEGGDVLTQKTVEMRDLTERPVVSKGLRLVEEVVIRHETTARLETINETIKRDKIDVEQPNQAVVVRHKERHHNNGQQEARKG